jgi:hypothetical protein
MISIPISVKNVQLVRFDKKLARLRARGWLIVRCGNTVPLKKQVVLVIDDEKWP